MFNESDDASTTSTPRGESTNKLGHRTQKYRKEWEQLSGFKNWLGPVKDNITKANCCYCNREIVSEITTIKKHAASAAHVKNAKSITGKPLSNFFKKVDENEVKKIDQVKRAEILICGFLSEHNISFNTADHLTQILKKAFPDSDIAKKLILGRTKATKIVTNVIGKNHKEELAKDLKKHIFQCYNR